MPSWKHHAEAGGWGLSDYKFLSTFAVAMKFSDKFICFDAEMTDRGELLELSIYSAQGNEIYHELFKPFSQKRWRTDIHHITPEMVKDKPFFSACRRAVQRIVDYADYVIGFAVDNDIRTLSNEGIKHLEDKHVIEVRNWYWLCRGNEKGVDINSGPGLQMCAPELGVEFGENAAHSASGDTDVTLRCFMALVEEFRQRYMADEPAPEKLEDVLERFEQEYAKARWKFREEKARGALHLVKLPDGTFKLAKSASGVENAKSVASVEVADRYKAEFEMRTHFQKRQTAGRIGVYKLRDADIQWFEAYTNTFGEEDSEFYKKMLKMNRLGMLS